MPDDQPLIISRRALLRRAGLASAAAAAGPAALLTTASEASAVQQTPAEPAAGAGRREAFENLTATEAELLDGVVDRLIPSDSLGPGAREARVTHYIDRALGGALSASREAYTAGLAALDRYAVSSRGRGFVALSSADKDAVLGELERGAAAGFTPGSAQFFSMVLNHTRQGMFGDPYYGGNANFAGWDLLGYPGVRTNVSAADQRAYEAGTLRPNHRSAYDSEVFNKATAAAAHDETERAHGH